MLNWDFQRFSRITQMEPAGFTEMDHKADWAVKVWAPDFAGLLIESARAMFSLTELHLRPEPRKFRQINLSAADRESILVAFLSELIYLDEQESLGFDFFDLVVDGYNLSARIEGAAIISQSKEIKAVTYHNLAICETAGRLEVTIVFDV
jgi:SHS2 domain-containing protein